MSVQAPGVIPASKHWVAPWCGEDDLPLGRLENSQGDTPTDIPLGLMIGAATDLLYVLSGRQWRAGHSVARPCAVARAFQYGSMVYPYGSLAGFGFGWGFPTGWQWTNVGLGYTQGSNAAEVILQGPVTQIEQVLLNGNALNPASDYTLYDRRRLVLAQGLAWPWQQDPQVPATQAGTAQITYDWGSTPPPPGRLACAELAIELALSFSGQDSCRLPSRVLSIATQGVNVAVGDALTYVLAHLTGIPAVDLFLESANPSRMTRRPIFVGPNSIRPREV